MLSEQEIQILLRTFLASLLGFVIGWERKAVGAPMRGRAVILTTMTAAALTAMTAEMYPSEVTRVIAGIVTGVGFLGAGAIIRASTGEVRGQATAASIWTMCCVGIIVGDGHLVLGILITLLTYIIIAWDQWPLITRLRLQRAQRQAKNTENQSSSEIKEE